MRQHNPIRTDSPSEKRPEANAEPAVAPLREKPGVLLVDDLAFMRNIMQWGLELFGFQVWTAANGREAIDRFREHKENIAVVLLDVCMPGLSGPETLQVLRKMNATCPACFISGYLGDYQVEELRQRGASVVAKPFLIDDLAKILWRLAHGGPAETVLSAPVRRKGTVRNSAVGLAPDPDRSMRSGSES